MRVVTSRLFERFELLVMMFVRLSSSHLGPTMRP